MLTVYVVTALIVGLAMLTIEYDEQKRLKAEENEEKSL